MVEIRRGFEGDRLPWLEPVEDEDAELQSGHEPGGYGGVIVAAIVVLLGIAIVTAGLVWYRRHRAATADIGQIIRAPEGPYKVRPADPGGMKPDRNGVTTYGTSVGQDLDSPLDLSALPEQPVAGPNARPQPAQPAPQPPAAVAPQPAQPAPQPPAAVAPQPATPAPQPAAPAPAPVPPPAVVKTPPPVAVASPAPPSGPAGTIQLGAFGTEAKANQVWKSMAGRFAYLKGLEKVIVPVAADGKTLYRLRASGPGAGALCARLRVAGEVCSGV